MLLNRLSRPGECTAAGEPAVVAGCAGGCMPPTGAGCCPCPPVLAAAAEPGACGCAAAATAPAERLAPAASGPPAAVTRRRLAAACCLPGPEDTLRRFRPRGPALAPPDVLPMAVLSALLAAPLGPSAATGAAAGRRRTVTFIVFGAVTVTCRSMPRRKPLPRAKARHPPVISARPEGRTVTRPSHSPWLLTSVHSLVFGKCLRETADGSPGTPPFK